MDHLVNTPTWLTNLGLLAGICTTCSFFPQVAKALKSKRTQDISKGMYSILSLGLFLWLVYGIFLQDIPLILTNSVSFSLSAVVLWLKIKHG